MVDDPAMLDIPLVPAAGELVFQIDSPVLPSAARLYLYTQLDSNGRPSGTASSELDCLRDALCEFRPGNDEIEMRLETPVLGSV